MKIKENILIQAEEEAKQSAERLNEALNRLEMHVQRRGTEVSTQLKDLSVELRHEFDEVRVKAERVLGEVSRTIREPQRVMDKIWDDLRKEIVNLIETALTTVDERSSTLLTNFQTSIRRVRKDLEDLLSMTLKAAETKPFSVWLGFLTVGFCVGAYLTSREQYRPRRARLSA